MEDIFWDWIRFIFPNRAVFIYLSNYSHYILQGISQCLWASIQYFLLIPINWGIGFSNPSLVYTG